MEIFIRNSKPSKAEKKEAVNAFCAYKKLLVNKNAELTNTGKTYIPLFIVFLILTIISFLLAIVTQVAAFYFVAVPIFIIDLFWLLVLLGSKKIGKNLFRYKKDTSLVIDETGVSLKRINSAEFKIVWENVYIIRIFNYVTVFYSKDKSYMFLVSNEYDPQIIEALKTYKKEDLLVK